MDSFDMTSFVVGVSVGITIMLCLRKMYDDVQKKYIDCPYLPEEMSDGRP